MELRLIHIVNILAGRVCLNFVCFQVSKWFKNARYMALRNRKVHHIVSFSHMKRCLDFLRDFENFLQMRSIICVPFFSLLQTESMKQPEGSKAGSGDSGPEAVMMEKNTETNETQCIVDESVMEENIGTNETQGSVDETTKEKNTVTNGIKDTLDETVMEENTEAPKIQDTLVETFMEKKSETNVIQDTADETVMEYTETKEVQDTVDVENNSETNEIQGTMEINEIQDTMDETVPLSYDGFTNQTTVSACNDKQEETEDANDSFPTPPEDESQQYLEQKDSSFALVV